MAMMSIPHETVLILGEIREQLSRVTASIYELGNNIDNIDGSLRNRFAMAALPLLVNMSQEKDVEDIASEAFLIADAMMKHI